MKFSVIIPCYNGSRFLGEAIESLRAQTRADWEAVIVDDGSTDNSLELAKSWAARDSRIRSLQQSNAGPSAARNTGVRASSGEYLVFLDADDLLEPEFFASMSAVLDATPEVNGCACEQIVMRTDGTTPVQPLPGRGDRLVIDDIIASNGWAPHAAMTRRLAFDQAGGFDASLRGAEDWDFWLRCLAIGSFAAVRRPMVRYRRHDQQSSDNFARMADHTTRMMAQFASRHPDIIDRYGRARHHESIAMIMLVYAGKALKSGKRPLALKISLRAWRHAPTSHQVLRRLAILWLPAWITKLLAKRKA